MYENVDSISIQISQKMETIQIPINSEVNKYVMVYCCRGILHQGKGMKYNTFWDILNAKDTMLSKTAQVQMNTYSLISST